MFNVKDGLLNGINVYLRLCDMQSSDSMTVYYDLALNNMTAIWLVFCVRYMLYITIDVADIHFWDKTISGATDNCMNSPRS